MKYLRVILIVSTCVFLVIFDISFLSNITIYNVSLLSSLLVLNLLILLSTSQTYFMAAALTISLSFTVLSSLPLLLTGILFFLWPNLMWYLRSGYFREMSAGLAVLYFLISSAVFEFIFLVHLLYLEREWSNLVLTQFGVFVVLHSLVGVILFIAAKKISGFFIPPKLS